MDKVPTRRIGLISIYKLNEVYFRVDSEEQYVHYELNDYFTFDVPNAKYLKRRNKYKNWDGKIRLYSLKNHKLYCGLYYIFMNWANERNYKVVEEKNVWYGNVLEKESITRDNVINELTPYITKDINVRDYQWDGIYSAIKYKRNLFLSPTGSGKSLIIYSITRYYFEKDYVTLIIVPTVSLVEQMYKDFINYGMNEHDIHKIRAGLDKNTNKNIVISTWQSLVDLKRTYFSKFDVVIGDEAHLFKAKSLVNILTMADNAKHRYGFTGTLDGTYTHKIILEGLFGTVRKLVSTTQLVKDKHLSDFDVKIIVLNHKKDIKFHSYKDEVDYLVNSEKRNNFIVKLCKGLKNNTILFYSYVETHGSILYDKIKNDRKSYFIHGKVSAEEREYVRALAEEQNDLIIVASYGVFSTGINIKNIHNVIFAFPSKSRVRIFQSIGRSLRLHKSKGKATIYDIGDNINGNNYTLKHYKIRKKHYESENYAYSTYKFNLSKDE